MRDFIESCERHNVFDVLSIREVAKLTVSEQQDSHHNAIGAGKSSRASERELFGGRLSHEEQNDELEEDLADVPSIFGEAVLYKVVQTIEAQMNRPQNQKTSRREHRQYLNEMENRVSGRNLRD